MITSINEFKKYLSNINENKDVSKHIKQLKKFIKDENNALNGKGHFSPEDLQQDQEEFLNTNYPNLNIQKIDAEGLLKKLTKINESSTDETVYYDSVTINGYKDNSEK